MGRAMFSPDVVGTDSFLELPEDAQLLYYRLGLEGTYGKIHGIRRIVRGYGMDASALDALYQAGYLLDNGGACWVKHYWVNNVFKKPNNNPAKEMEEIASGAIGFEGHPFKSPFCLMNGNKPYTRLIEAYRVGSTVTETETETVSGAYPEALAPQEQKQGTGAGARGGGDGRGNESPDSFRDSFRANTREGAAW